MVRFFSWLDRASKPMSLTAVKTGLLVRTALSLCTPGVDVEKKGQMSNPPSLESHEIAQEVLPFAVARATLFTVPE